MNTTEAKEYVTKAGEQLLDAVSKQDTDAVRMLVTRGVDIETSDSNGRTALLLATHHNAIAVARLLIDAGADVNAKDNITDSPYLYAGAEGRLEILRMTLEYGADLSSINRYGGTALIPAAHHGHIQTVAELLQTDLDIDHVNDLGWTALLEAIILGDGGPVYLEIVRLLIDAGADVSLSDSNNVSPMAHATERGYTEIVKLLGVADSF